MGMCWEGATTRRATARKVEQRPQRAPGWLSRACSAVTQQVNVFGGKKVNVYGHLQRKLSGQLAFLALTMCNKPKKAVRAPTQA